MKHYLPLILFLFLVSCGNNQTTINLPLEIVIDNSIQADEATSEAFLQKIHKYSLNFNGEFGNRKHIIQRKGKAETIQVRDIPYDSNLTVAVEVIGLAWNESSKEWKDEKVLASGETSGGINWSEGNSETVKIVCKLTEVGEATYEEIINIYNSK